MEAFKTNPNLELGKSVLEQIALFIGKKNMYPAPKIFSNAIRVHKYYEKHMKDIGLAEIVMQSIRSKESKGTKQL